MTIKKLIKMALAIIFSLTFLLYCQLSVFSSDKEQEELDKQIKKFEGEFQQVNQRIIDLNRQLEQLKKDIQFPEDNEIFVYLKNYTEGIYILEKLKVKINGDTKTSHRYGDVERTIFAFGGTQPIYKGVLPEGSHKLELVFSGIVGTERTPREDITILNFKKEKAPIFIQVAIKYDATQGNLLVDKLIW